MFTSVIFTSLSESLIGVPETSDPLYIASLGANVLTLFLFVVASRFRLPIRRSILVVIAMLTMSFGTFPISDFSSVLSGVPSLNLALTAGYLTGFGSGIFLILWGEIIVSLGTRNCIIYNVVCCFIAAAISILLTCLPVAIAQPFIVICPILEFVFYRRYSLYNGIALSSGKKRAVRWSKLVKQLIVLGLVFGFSFGIIRGLMAPIDSGSLVHFKNTLIMLFIMISCLLVYAVSIIWKRDFGNLTYKIALPLMAIGFLMLPLSNECSIVGMAMYRIGYHYFYIIIWALWVFMALKNGISAQWMLSRGLLSLQLSKLVGFVASVAIIRYIDSPFSMAMLSGVSLFLILIFALFFKEDSLTESRWESVRPAESNDETVFSLPAYELAAEKLKLSPRETEVFLLLLRGRSRAAIADLLVIAQETVKAHVGSIYQKAGVHSKQELIDRVEDMITSSSNFC